MPGHQALEPNDAIIASVGYFAGRMTIVAAMSIRNLDERVMELLRIRAARHGRSMEAEVRAILVDAVGEPDDAPGLLDVLAERFAEVGGVELDLPRRDAVPRAPEFT